MVGLLPSASWLPAYRLLEQGPSDLVAGLTVGALAVPQSLAYALIAGAGAHQGLVSDLQIMYVFLGTSRCLVVGPVAVMCLMLHMALDSQPGLTEFTPEWSAAARFVCFTVSAAQLLLAAIRAGPWLSRLLPDSAVHGFTAGAALIIASTQFPALLGVAKCKGGCGFFGASVHVALSLPSAAPLDAACGAGCFVVLSLFRRAEGRLTSKLGPLVVVCTSVLFSLVFRPTSLVLVGDIPAGLPSLTLPTLPTNPAIAWSLALRSVPIALVGYAEALAIARSTARPGVDCVDPGQELLALGACNAFTGLIGGFPVSGSFSRTAVNASSGAQTPLSVGVCAVFVCVVLMAATQLLSLLPVAAVGAIVLSCILPLANPKEGLRHWEAGERGECAVFFAVWATTLVLGPEMGISVGVAMPRLLALRREKKDRSPDVELRSELEAGSIDGSEVRSSLLSKSASVHR